MDDEQRFRDCSAALVCVMLRATLQDTIAGPDAGTLAKIIMDSYGLTEQSFALAVAERRGTGIVYDFSGGAACAAPQEDKSIAQRRAVIVALLDAAGWPPKFAQVEIAIDPWIDGVSAVRATWPNGDRREWLFHEHEEELEPVEFTQWPPKTY